MTEYSAYDSLGLSGSENKSLFNKTKPLITIIRSYCTMQTNREIIVDPILDAINALNCSQEKSFQRDRLNA